MVFGDGQLYRGFGGYSVFWLVRCISESSCQFGTDLALVEQCVCRCQFYRGFEGYLVFLFLGCGSECHCQFGTDLALME